MKVLPEGTKKVIHVHRPAILEGEPDVFIIRPEGGHKIFTNKVELMGHSKMINDPRQPQGLRVWVETWAEVRFE